MLKALADIALLLVFAVLAIVVFSRQLRGIFRLVTGRVPAYRIVRFFLVVIPTLAILYPILIHVERKSALHLVIKPAAEARINANASVANLLGRPLVFGQEWSISYEGQGGDASGGFTFPVHGSTEKGDVDVAAKEAAGSGV